MIVQEYEIRVRGSLPVALSTAFQPLVSRTEAGGHVTVLSGLITDQSELTGILEGIDNLGLVLLEVRPLGPAHASDGPRRA